MSVTDWRTHNAPLIRQQWQYYCYG